MHFLRAMRSFISFFPYINFSCWGCLFFGQSSKLFFFFFFPLITSGVKTDASTWLLSSDCFGHTRRPRTAWKTSHKADKFSRAIQCTGCENRVMKLRKPIFACHKFARKPPQNALMRVTLGHFQTVRLQDNSGQTESV